MLYRRTLLAQRGYSGRDASSEGESGANTKPKHLQEKILACVKSIGYCPGYLVSYLPHMGPAMCSPLATRYPFTLGHLRYQHLRGSG